MQLAVFVLVPALAGLLGATAARAADVLYATAASQGRIDGFRLGPAGQLAAAPDVQISTGKNPRRILVVGCTLYVAERDRVEAFRIKARGGLDRLGRTVIDPDVRATDLAASPDGGTLYIAQKGFDRVVAYPLGTGGEPAVAACSCASDADCDGSAASCVEGRCVNATRACTLPPSAGGCATGQTCVFDFTSCAIGPFATRYQSLATSGSLVFAAGSGFRGGIDAFQTAAGALPTVACDPPKGQDRPPLTRPFWCRRRIRTPRLTLDDLGILYVEDRLRGRILGFRQLTPSTLVDIEDTSMPCTDTTESCVCSNKRSEQQKPDVKTVPLTAYEELVIQGSTLFASEFHRGRVDAYSLRPDEARFIAKRPRRSSEDVRMSPVGMAIADGVLYLAGGELDRLRAYDIRRSGDGTFVGLRLIGQTDEQKGSFPNDVALAVLANTCQ